MTESPTVEICTVVYCLKKTIYIIQSVDNTHIG